MCSLGHVANRLLRAKEHDILQILESHYRPVLRMTFEFCLPNTPSTEPLVCVLQRPGLSSNPVPSVLKVSNPSPN